MSTLTATEKVKLENIFLMQGGYVLDFSNKSFGDFILTSVGTEIEKDIYAYNGPSKANRLRTLWHLEADHTVGKLSREMLKYWEAKRLVNDVPIVYEQGIFDECMRIAKRLEGKAANRKSIKSEEGFIIREFTTLPLEKMSLDPTITDVIRQRVDEIRKCLEAKAPLAVMFLCGSTLEGILLGVATKSPQKFNQASSAPKKDGKVLPLHQWTLSNLIDTARELKIIQEDVKKYSHVLRDFRNYIHPNQQNASGFSPHEHTAKIGWQVLQAAIYEIIQSELQIAAPISNPT